MTNILESYTEKPCFFILDNSALAPNIRQNFGYVGLARAYVNTQRYVELAELMRLGTDRLDQLEKIIMENGIIVLKGSANEMNCHLRLMKELYHIVRREMNSSEGAPLAILNYIGRLTPFLHAIGEVNPVGCFGDARKAHYEAFNRILKGPFYDSSGEFHTLEGYSKYRKNKWPSEIDQNTVAALFAIAEILERDKPTYRECVLCHNDKHIPLLAKHLQTALAENWRRERIGLRDKFKEMVLVNPSIPESSNCSFRIHLNMKHEESVIVA